MKKEWRVRAGAVIAALALCALPGIHRQRQAQATGAMAAATGERLLIPGGQAVGVALKTQGVLVVAGGEQEQINSPLREGDLIVSAAGKSVRSAAELSQAVLEAQQDALHLGIVRDGREMTVEAAVSADQADGKRRLGVWVRDSTAGVGTLSYVDPATWDYGALGHAIVDADTGALLTVQEGAVMEADVVGVVRGQVGKAGELRGSFLKEGRQIGSLVRNCSRGIYGRMDDLPDALLYPEGLPMGTQSEVHPGAATIISTVDGEGPVEYAIEIVRCLGQEKSGQKDMMIRVTDERLIAKTGGIVQGMSGSPIIQDGKLVGAVTHVLVNDPTRGYGIFIENMLEAAK